MDLSDFLACADFLQERDDAFDADVVPLLRRVGADTDGRQRLGWALWLAWECSLWHFRMEPAEPFMDLRDSISVNIVEQIGRAIPSQERLSACAAVLRDAGYFPHVGRQLRRWAWEWFMVADPEREHAANNVWPDWRAATGSLGRCGIRALILPDEYHAELETLRVLIRGADLDAVDARRIERIEAFVRDAERRGYGDGREFASDIGRASPPPEHIVADERGIAGVYVVFESELLGDPLSTVRPRDLRRIGYADWSISPEEPSLGICLTHNGDRAVFER